MSNTPLTDAELLRILNDDEIDLNDEVDRMADFARTLERELNAAKSALKDCECAISAFLGFHSDYLSNTQVATLSETLAKLKPFINP